MLGTLVSIRVHDLAERAAHRAIEAAFKEIATVHRLMSFHDPDSDLSRLNRAGVGNPVAVHHHTYEVLRQAIQIAAGSEGCFDVSVGAELVEWGLLPCPAGGERSCRGSWRDIELLSGGGVVLHRPLCIDFGGIAKGFAVDRGTECLRGHDARRTVVNAGGEIRVQGKEGQLIGLREAYFEDRMPLVELVEGSMASSSGHLQRRLYGGRLCGPHVDGAYRTPAPTERFVCVTAERCVVADALTKVVMARGRESAPVLRRFNASAYFHDPGQPWQQLEGESAIAG